MRNRCIIGSGGGSEDESVDDDSLTLAASTARVVASTGSRQVPRHLINRVSSRYFSSHLSL